jgi:hypothetical protein|uniref:Uncharacterized protein n=1 Tax=virus sp. ctmTa7 TaxID=2828255 RepID=A0A8S5RCG8_9VIRU|nr:MAG TPA: hypothetical protein [virus sp. ctmTa7]
MYLIVIVDAIIVWFLLTIVFKPLGSIISKIWDDTSKTLNEKEEKEEDNKNG